MKGEEKQVQKAVENIAAGVSPDIINQTTEILTTILKTGTVPTEALGFSRERIDNTYSQAYRLYNTGKYEDASYLFRMLVFLEPTDPKHYLGLAACFHMMKEYAGAVQVYMSCSAIDGESPLPFFHASDCYLQMGDKLSAILMLELAIQRAGKKPEYQILKERSLMTIENLKKELAKAGIELSSKE